MNSTYYVILFQIQPPDCENEECGNVGAAIVFFCSFYVLVSFIILNVLIAVMIENFSLFYSSEEAALLSHHDLKGFLAKWNIIDRERKGAIPAKHVKFLLRLLDVWYTCILYLCLPLF
jgi:hypothetical protein